MDAARRNRTHTARGASRLLEHCVMLGSAIATQRPTARDRLESELGCELAQRLILALASRPRPVFG